jgi:hypothetical protein
MAPIERLPRRRTRRAVLSLACGLVSVPVLGALPATATVTWSQTAELTGSGGGFFAKAVAVSGTTALVGDSGANGNVGAVFVYTDAGGSWSQSGELTPSDNFANGNFGTSVALSSSGTTAAVGAPSDTGSGPGHVYVFTYSSGAWSQTAELTDPTVTYPDGFGGAVSLSPSAFDLLVGADTAPGSCAPVCKNNGTAYVYSSSAGGSWSVTTALTAPDAVNMGSSVAISGSTFGTNAVVGDPGHAAYFFGLTSGTWLPVTEFPVNDPQNTRVPVAVYESTALVGDPELAVAGDTGQGAVHVLSHSGHAWTEGQQLTATGPAFGTAVALEGATALISAQNYNSGQGAAYIFGFDGTSWSEATQLTAADGATEDGLGFAAGMSPDAATVILGAPQQGAAHGGAGYVFSEPGTTVPCPGGVGDTAALVSDLAPGNGVVDLLPNCTYTLTAAQTNGWGLPTVSGTLVINGNGATITRSTAPATPQFGFFDVSGESPSLTLNDLTVSNGNGAPGSGSSGGVDVSGTLSLRDVSMLDDVGQNDGGAVDAFRATVDIQDSTFSGDQSQGGNEAVFLVSSSLTVSGSTFSNEPGALAGSGSPMVVSTSSFSGATSRAAITANSRLTATGDTFANNLTSGIFVGQGVTATVTDSTFTDNSSNLAGGGIFDAGTLTLRSSTFTDNVVRTTVTPSIPLGGGLFVEPGVGATPKVSGTLMADNTLQVSGSAPQPQDCGVPSGAVLIDEGYNLEAPGDTSCHFTGPNDASGDPKVLPVGANGGPTETVALGPTSAGVDQVAPGAIDGNGAALCPDVTGADQRGLARPQRLGCDIGAFEQGAVNVGVSPNPVTSSGPVVLTATITPSSVQAAGTPAAEGTVAFYDNGALLGTAPLNGSNPDTAMLDPTLSGTSNSIAVGYAGDPAGLYSLVAGPPSPSASTLTASPNLVSPPGTSATATVTLKDGQGLPVRGDEVGLVATGLAVTTPVSPTTNAAGAATFSVTDSESELVTLSATDLTASVALAQHAEVDFATRVPIVTLAGGGTSGTTEGVGATDGSLSLPTGAVRDAAGNVIIADLGDSLVRVVAESDGTFYGQTMTAGDIYTLVGGGSSVGSPRAPRDTFVSPVAVDVDPSGNVIMAGQDNAGDNLVGALAASSGHFYGQDMVAGTLYIVAGSVGGTGTTVQNGMPASQANVSGSALAVDASGNVLIADSTNNVVWALPDSPNHSYGQDMVTGDIYIVAGGGAGGSGDGTLATSATLASPSGVAVDGAGNVIIADTGNNAIRVVDEEPGTSDLYGVSTSQGHIVTVAGQPNQPGGYSGDGGSATGATLSGPQGVAVDAGGTLVFADFGNSVIRAIPGTGNSSYGITMVADDIYTIAGNPQATTLGDGGPALEASITPWAVGVYSPGVLIIPDVFNGLIREVGPIITAPLPGGSTGDAYSAAATVAATTGPVTFSVSSGSLPPGLILDPSSGDISGTPTSGGTFTFTLSATDSSTPSQTAATGPISIDIAAPAPAAPTGLTATVGDGRVVLNWTGSAGAANYSVFDATTTGGEHTGGTAACSAIAPATTCTVTGLNDGQTSYFVVVATNAGGASGPSGEAHATPAAIGTSPRVTKIGTGSGPMVGGTSVTITGSGFSTTPGGTNVYFGPNPAASVTCTSSSSCTAVSPAGIGTVDVTVEVNGVSSPQTPPDQFAYTSPCGAVKITEALTLHAGQILGLGPGSSVAGALTIQSGAGLLADGAIIRGSIKATGPVVFEICGSTLTGAVNVTGSTTAIIFGDDEGSACPGNTISGQMTLISNKAGVEFDSNKVSGAVNISGTTGLLVAPDTGSVEVLGNKGSGSVKVT